MAEGAIDFGNIGSNEGGPEGKKGSFWLIVFGVVGLAGGLGGFLAAGMMRPAAPKDPIDKDDLVLPKVDLADPEGGEEFEYVDFQTITVTLREPTMNRYLRATLKLAMRKKDWQAVNQYFEKKRPEAKNWLTLYLADLSLQDVRGAKMLNQRRREIRDGLNDKLWPGSRPVIDHVLLEEFAVQ